MQSFQQDLPSVADANLVTGIHMQFWYAKGGVSVQFLSRDGGVDYSNCMCLPWDSFVRSASGEPHR